MARATTLYRVTETLSKKQARKLSLLSQFPRLPGGGLHAADAALQHLGYVQLDTLSVVARAHHHTLWNRARGYRPQHLDALFANRRAFEYWAHAAAILPMTDYRFCLPRMASFAAGAKHWYAPDKKLMREVLARIAGEGALRARDFADAAGRGATAMWDWRPTKRALEGLFMEGRLMVTRREGFQKVYDLSERVLPADVDTRMPSREEVARFLVRRYLQANGLGRAREIAYLRSDARRAVESCIADMAAGGEAVAVRVGGREYYALPQSLQLLNKRLPRKRARILSPFDNLVIQRGRMRELFDFDYRVECYVPAAKRKYGYFALPVLYGDRLVARMDCKAMRDAGVLQVRRLTLESDIADDEFAAALAAELKLFAAFNGCAEVVSLPLRQTG